MRVVLDTNVLLAALITSGTPPDRIYEAWKRRRFRLLTSEWQLAEFRRASRYPSVRPYLKPWEAGTLVNGLRARAELLDVLPIVERSPDPDDDPVLAMAVGGRADYLVTGDKSDLLFLERIEATQIVSPRSFLEVLLRRPQKH